MDKKSRNTNKSRSQKVLYLLRISPKQLTRSLMLIITVLSIALLPFDDTAATAYKDMNLTDQAKSYTYLYALQSCITNNGMSGLSGVAGSTLPVDKATSGDWFGTLGVLPPSAAASYLSPGTTPTTGKNQCNSIVKDATKVWGYKNSLELICSFVQNTACSTNVPGVSSGFQNINLAVTNFTSAIKKRVYSGSNPTIAGEHLYRYYVSAFSIGCSAKESSNPPGDQKYTLKVVDSKGQISSKTYQGSTHGSKRSVYTDVPGAVEKSCSEIVNEANKYATIYANHQRSNPDEKPPVVTNVEDEKKENNPPQSSCVIDSIGWIVCPSIMFLANIADNAYVFLASNFLEIGSDLLGNDARAAWGSMQTIANVAFVIAFIVIIYSQLTGSGIGSYGVKKLLPRIIIAAILVNTSFIICQVAVDLSNILGYGLKNMFNTITLPESVNSSTSSFDVGAKGGIGLVGIAATILAGAVAVYLALPFLAGAVLSAVIALLSVGFLLIARKAIIILLVVISPVAFVAYLLPNTEKFFTKWRQTFTALLLVFPVVGLLFGAGGLASTILKSTAGNDQILQLIAAIAAVIPLFAVWPILKGSINAAGGIGAKINGISGKMQAKANNGGRKTWDNSRFGRAYAFNAQRRQKARDAIREGRYTGQSAIGRYMSDKSRAFNDTFMGTYGKEANKQAIKTSLEETEQGVKDSMGLLQDKGLTALELQQVAMGQSVKGIDANDESVRRAAIRTAMSQNGLKANEDLITASGGMSEALRKEVADGVASNKLGSKANYLGGDMVDKIARGEIKSEADLDLAAVQRIGGGKLSAEGLAGQDAAALERLSRVANQVQGGSFTTTDGNTSIKIDNQNLRAFQDQSYNVREADSLNKSVTAEQLKHIENIDIDPNAYRPNSNKGPENKEN